MFKKNNTQLSNQDLNDKVQGLKKENNIQKIIIVILLLLLAIIFLFGRTYISKMVNKGKTQTAIITTSEKEVEEVAPGDVRVVLNPNVIIEKETMQNLCFNNLNEDRLLKIKIMDSSEKECFYESDYIETGKELKADVIDTSKLNEGINDAIGQVYSYDNEKNMISQTNVEMELNVIK